MSQSSSDTYRNTLRYQGQDYRFTPTFLRKRDPIPPYNTSPDIKPPENQGYYPVNSLWTNTTNDNVWILKGIHNNLANWELLNGGGGGSVSIMTPDGNLVPPNGGIFTYDSPGNTVAITGNIGTGTISFDATPVLDELLVDVDLGNTPVHPSAQHLILTSSDSSIAVTGTFPNIINLTTSTVGTFIGLISGGDSQNVDPDGITHRITLESPDGTVGITRDGVSLSTINFTAITAIQNHLKININGATDVSPTAADPSKFLFTASAGITITNPAPNTINFAGSGAGGFGGLIGGSNGVTAVPDGANKVTVASANGTVTVNGGGSTIDLNALPTLQNHLQIDINGGAATIAPTVADPAQFKFTATNDLTISKTDANTINFDCSSVSNPARSVIYTDDFVYTNQDTAVNNLTGSGDLNWAQSGSPVWVDTLASLAPFVDADHPGVRLSNTTLNVGTDSMWILANKSGAGITLGGGALTTTWVVKIQTLSVLGTRYELRLGLAEKVSSPAYVQNNALNFVYSDNLNGGSWVLSTSSGGVTVQTNTAVPVTLGWHVLKISVNAAGTSVVFSIDGVDQAAIVANIPTAAAISGWYNLRPINQPLTAASIAVDLFTQRLDLTNPRY